MKTKLILPMIMSNMLSGLASAVMIYISDVNPIWIGSLLATLPLPFLLMVMTNAFGVTRTSKSLPLNHMLSFAGLGIVAYVVFASGGPQAIGDYVALGMGILGVVSLLWYVWVFTPYGREKSTAIIKGETLPELQYHHLDGTKGSSASFTGSKTLIVFFRANWCPFCMNQLKEVLAQAERIAKAGVKVKFISNQGMERNTELAEKLNMPHHFEILQDEDLAAAKTLGIDDIGGSPVGMSGYPADTVMATVIALDEAGQVIFGDETDNYRVRPHPDTFLPVFEG